MTIQTNESYANNFYKQIDEDGNSNAKPEITGQLLHDLEAISE